MSLLTSYQLTQLLPTLSLKNERKSLILIFKRLDLKEFAVLIMNHDHFILRILICFSIQSSLAFTRKQIDEDQSYTPCVVTLPNPF